ncbi:MAG TPA: nucleoside monophosphate kinase [Candidatus Saccharimonadales bacterium]|jgi:adenylate kinase|nr:nucleoside monophosphate kinase [Candidatus Saccharimonadales bacterium]
MIILMGVAGSGKSMQGRMLADEYGYAWISTGEILRVLITGKRRHEMLQGKLLSDEEVIKVMDKVLDLIDTKQEFVLDGFPRSVVQAEWLISQTKKQRFALTAVIHLVASEEVVKGRLMQRGRVDDNEEAIAERFKEYQSVTLPIIEHFRQDSIPVYDIEAAQEPRTVHDQIMNIVRGA